YLRRTSMKKLLFIFAAISVLALTAFASNRTQTLRFDIALDGTTMVGFLSPNGPPQRGNTFIINGKLFPAGTLQPGSQQNDPNDASNIGDFYCRATFANNVPAAPELPELFNTQLFRFRSHNQGITGGIGSFGIPGNIFGNLPDINQLTTEGIESAAPGTTWTRVVTGGTGIYLGVSGSETIQTIGTNASGGFNERVIFKLIERSDD
ncbi:MAG: hypothetical protein ABI891_05850, partial [Acidobacteriota bacterium]